MRLLPCQERVKPETRALRGQLSHPPTGMPRRTISPGEGLLFPSLHHHTFLPKGSRRTVLHCAHPMFYLEGGLDGLPLRVSNEGLLRPRVARAQEII